MREIQLTQSSHPEKEENEPYHIFMVIINWIGRHKKERHGGFLENTACPPSSESPLKYLSASLFFNCQSKKILESCNAQHFLKRHKKMANNCWTVTTRIDIMITHFQIAQYEFH